ncbi:MAG TPA: AraC family ligand binding domain-containing protein [Candidatus Saccharimonadia bacterium]|nr:AraC family ligand binding domain-containing protein [Candidatus Saccharimonadia bacterium]
MDQTKTEALISAWRNYLATHFSWQAQIKGHGPIPTGCGLLYELPNPLARPGEDFAIADMRHIPFAEPHYHPKPNYEIYFVLQGTALVVNGTNERQVKPGDVVLIEPDHAHFTIPDENFVIAVVNTPPFKPEIYITVTESDPSVKFDQNQFARLTSHT